MMAAKNCKTNAFGACTFANRSPVQLKPDTKVLKVVISFDEALKLNIALDECVRKLNTYNRATKPGRRAAVMIILHLDDDKRRIRVNEGKLPPG